LCNANDNDENLQPLCKSCHKEKTKLEQEDGSYIRLNPTESSFNESINNIIGSSLYKSYAFIEPVAIYNKNGNTKLYHFDMNRCRKNILRYSKYNYPVFTVMDQVRKYKGIKHTGLYFVSNKFSYFPLRGDGWYSLPTIEYCLENNIIQEYDIKYIIKSSMELPYNYFNNMIDTFENTLDFEIQKLAINSIIGNFNKSLENNETYKTLCIQNNLGNAMDVFYNKDGCFIEEFDIQDKAFYQIYSKQCHKSSETESLLYKQIVEIEAIELHKLTKIIESKGGKIINLNTDCVSAEFKGNLPFETDKNHNLLNYYYDDKKTVLKYKLEFKNIDMIKNTVARMKQYKRDGFFSYKKQTETKITDETIEYDDLIDIVFESNKSYLIEGRAGTGKSTFVNRLVAKLEKAKKTVIKLAPTNKAALIIKGQTINKFFAGIRKADAIKRIVADYIFVDEMSMLKEVFYKYLYMVKQIKPETKFILTGDFNQLLPVNDRVKNIDYRNSEILRHLTGNVVELTICRRSDNRLFNMCKNVEQINIEEFGSSSSYLNLSYTNKKRIDVNEEMNKEHFKKFKEKGLKLEGLVYDPNSQNVILFKGVPVISKVNDKELDIVNNETFKIKEIADGKIVMKNDYKTITINQDEFQHLFYIAYCITTARSQGSTFNTPYKIHEWEKMDERLKYVALSRAKDINLINIAK
jgi:KaiC/GvpD/RAD55 family RecA-like ATPase